MARTHARTRGKSSSSKPMVKDVSFVTISKKEVEALVVKMAKDDEKPSKIGLVLRDTYGVPCVKTLTGKSIGDILKDNNLTADVPEDLAALVEKARVLKKHLELNTRDTHNKRGLILIESKIRRLTKYYKRTGKVAQNWNFN